MSLTLAAALDALEEVATAAGVDSATARREGEALAATVAEPSKGAFVDWCSATGRPSGAEAFFDAASRGRRYRSASTATMSSLAVGRSSHAPTYAAALGDVALAAAELGEPDPRAMGNAATAAAAQLGESQHAPLAPRDPAPTLGDDVARSLVQQLSVVQRKLAGLDLSGLAGVPGPNRRAGCSRTALGRRERRSRRSATPTSRRAPSPSRRSRRSRSLRPRPSRSCSPSSTAWSGSRR